MNNPSLEETLGELIANHKQAIIERAVDKLASRVAKMCLPDVQKMFNDQAKSVIDAKIAEQTNGIMAGTFKESDCYGNIREGSKAKTMVELILDRSAEWMNERVDSYGRASGSEKARRIEWLVSKAAEELVKKDLEPEIAKAKADFKAAVQGKLSLAFRQTLAECIKP